MMEIILIILAGIIGGVARTILGYLGEKDDGEPFDSGKCVKTLLRATLGGAILGLWLQLSPRETFFAAFLADLAWKNVWDFIKPKI